MKLNKKSYFKINWELTIISLVIHNFRTRTSENVGQLFASRGKLGLKRDKHKVAFFAHCQKSDLHTSFSLSTHTYQASVMSLAETQPASREQETCERPLPQCGPGHQHTKAQESDPALTLRNKLGGLTDKKPSGPNCTHQHFTDDAKHTHASSRTLFPWHIGDTTKHTVALKRQSSLPYEMTRKVGRYCTELFKTCS